MRNSLQNDRYDVADARVHLIGDNWSNISNETHGLIYCADKRDRRRPDLVIYPDDCKPGYCMIRDDYLMGGGYSNKNDVWKDMVAKRLSAYNRATGGTDFWKIYDILIVPRGALGEPKFSSTIIDTYIHKKLDNQSATMLGNDLLNFNFENNLKNINTTDRAIFFSYVTDLIKKLYNFVPNEIELDCAQELEMADWFYHFEQWLECNSRLECKPRLGQDPKYYYYYYSHLNFPMRFGKSLYSIKKMLILSKKYGFKTVLMFAWILNANTSFLKERNKWNGFTDETVNFMNKNQKTFIHNKFNWVDISLHYSLSDFKKAYSFLNNCPGPLVVLGDEFDDGAWNKNNKEKIDWMLKQGKIYV